MIFYIYKNIYKIIIMREIIFENIKFLVGQNSQENWDLFDSCNKINNEYIWFHLNSFLSKNSLINYSAEFCKKNIKYIHLSNLKICYTSLKKLKKTNKISEVIITGKKNII